MYSVVLSLYQLRKNSPPNNVAQHGHEKYEAFTSPGIKEERGLRGGEEERRL